MPQMNETMRTAIEIAEQEARSRGSDTIVGEDLLFGILIQREWWERCFPRLVGLQPHEVAGEIDQRPDRRGSGPRSGDVTVGPDAGRFLDAARRTANLALRELFGAREVMLAMLVAPNDPTAVALTRTGITAADLRASLDQYPDAEQAPAAEAPQPLRAVTHEAISSFAASEPPSLSVHRVGWEQELKRLARIIAGDTSNKALIFGPSGCGKTTMLHALAAAMTTRHKQLVPVAHVVDARRMVTGVRHRGQVEERLAAVLRESERLGPGAVCIDSAELLLGAARDESRVMEGAHQLPMTSVAAELANTRAPVVLAVHERFQAHFDDEPRFDRFERIRLAPLRGAQLVEALERHQPRLRARYGVCFGSAAISAAVEAVPEDCAWPLCDALRRLERALAEAKVDERIRAHARPIERAREIARLRVDLSVRIGDYEEAARIRFVEMVAIDAQLVAAFEPVEARMVEVIKTEASP